MLGCCSGGVGVGCRITIAAEVLFVTDEWVSHYIAARPLSQFGAFIESIRSLLLSYDLTDKNLFPDQSVSENTFPLPTRYPYTLPQISVAVPAQLETPGRPAGLPWSGYSHDLQVGVSLQQGITTVSGWVKWDYGMQRFPVGLACTITSYRSPSIYGAAILSDAFVRPIGDIIIPLPAAPTVGVGSAGFNHELYHYCFHRGASGGNVPAECVFPP